MSYLNTNIEDISVKKNNPLDSRKFQDSVFSFFIYVAGYDWEDLTLKAICELAV
jgi:hypothetical protein